jgi:hypothetical protein
MIKQTLVAVTAIALVLMTVAGTAYARLGDNAYQSGWRDGYAAHVKGGPYFVLSISQAYSRGYNDGWNAWNER